MVQEYSREYDFSPHRRQRNNNVSREVLASLCQFMAPPASIYIRLTITARFPAIFPKNGNAFRLLWKGSVIVITASSGEWGSFGDN